MGPGLRHDRPPIVATSWYPILRGKFLGTCTLTVPHWQVRIANCRVIRWGHGLRIFLADVKRTDHFDKDHYTEIFNFVSDEAQQHFEEAALRALRRKAPIGRRRKTKKLH